MQSFEVHSNESACRKSGRLGMEQVYVLLDSVVCASSYLISGASPFELKSTRRQGTSSQDEFGSVEFTPPPLFSTKFEMGMERILF